MKVALISLLLLVLLGLKNPVRMNFLKQCFSNLSVHSHHPGFMQNYRFSFIGVGGGGGLGLSAVMPVGVQGPHFEQQGSGISCSCLHIPLPGFVFLHFVELLQAISLVLLCSLGDIAPLQPLQPPPWAPELVACVFPSPRLPRRTLGDRQSEALSQ